MNTRRLVQQQHRVFGATGLPHGGPCRLRRPCADLGPDVQNGLGGAVLPGLQGCACRAWAAAWAGLMASVPAATRAPADGPFLLCAHTTCSGGSPRRMARGATPGCVGQACCCSWQSSPPLHCGLLQSLSASLSCRCGAAAPAASAGAQTSGITPPVGWLGSTQEIQLACAAAGALHVLGSPCIGCRRTTSRHCCRHPCRCRRVLAEVAEGLGRQSGPGSDQPGSQQQGPLPARVPAGAPHLARCGRQRARLAGRRASLQQAAGAAAPNLRPCLLASPLQRWWSGPRA